MEAQGAFGRQFDRPARLSRKLDILKEPVVLQVSRRRKETGDFHRNIAGVLNFVGPHYGIVSG
jgi:hypothetical protein